MMRYDRVYLYTPASNLFLFLESLFLFLGHRTYNSGIDNLFEWGREKMMSQWEYLKELSGLDLECCDREEIEELVRESKSGVDIGECISRWVNGI